MSHKLEREVGFSPMIEALQLGLRGSTQSLWLVATDGSQSCPLTNSHRGSVVSCSAPCRFISPGGYPSPRPERRASLNVFWDLGQVVPVLSMCCHLLHKNNWPGSRDGQVHNIQHTIL